jgi:ubiquinol-cytochrome c reductase cytochrome b subunit
LVHLILLHQVGSNNPLGVVADNHKLSFYPYFYVKDLLSFILLIVIFCTYVYFAPNDRGHPDNYIPANPIVTPAHIVPE